MTILIIVRQIAGGGAEASMSRLRNELSKRGLVVCLATIKPGSLTEVPEVTHLNLSSTSNRVTQFIEAFFSLRKLTREKRFKKVILNCELAEFLGAIAIPRGSRVLVVEHTTRPWTRRKILGFSTRLILAFRRVKWITVVGNSSRIWPFNQVATYIPNLVEKPKVEEIFPSSSSSMELVYVGRLAPSKRPELAIKVAMELDLPLHVFGDGELMLSLKELARSSDIKFYGFVPNVWEKISPNWILIFPSSYEGDGMVVLEAVLHGNLVLLSDNEDLRRLDLPEQSYFSDYFDLRGKLLTLKKGESDLHFRSLAKDIARISHQRSPQEVGSKWIELLGHGAVD
jgi:glycosyltransferase involved in cell wall biosynthesis